MSKEEHSSPTPEVNDANVDFANVESKKAEDIPQDQKSSIKDKAKKITSQLAQQISHEKEFVLIPLIAKIVYVVKDAKVDLSLVILGKSIASTSVDSQNPSAVMGGSVPGAAKSKITFKLEDSSLKYLADIEYKSPPVVGQWKTFNSSGTLFHYGKDDKEI